jgi:hypothetical protein
MNRLHERHFLSVGWRVDSKRGIQFRNLIGDETSRRLL